MKLEDLNLGDIIWVVPWRHKKPVQIEVQNLYEEENVVCGVDLIDRKHITVLIDWCGDSSKEARKLVEKRDDKKS